MRTIVMILVMLGGILPIAAVLWAVVVARRPYEDLVRRKAEALKNGGSAKAMEDAGVPTTTYGDLTWSRTDEELARRKAAVDSYGWPVALGLLGVACATVGGVWSLYL